MAILKSSSRDKTLVSVLYLLYLYISYHL